MNWGMVTGEKRYTRCTVRDRKNKTRSKVLKSQTLTPCKGGKRIYAFGDLLLYKKQWYIINMTAKESCLK